MEVGQPLKFDLKWCFYSASHFLLEHILTPKYMQNSRKTVNVLCDSLKMIPLWIFQKSLLKANLFLFSLKKSFYIFFQLFLELEPQLREVIQCFYDSKYGQCLKLLDELKVWIKILPMYLVFYWPDFKCLFYLGQFSSGYLSCATCSDSFLYDQVFVIKYYFDKFFSDNQIVIIWLLLEIHNSIIEDIDHSVQLW